MMSRAVVLVSILAGCVGRYLLHWTVERVHGMYAMRCPLYRTLHTAIALSSRINW